MFAQESWCGNVNYISISFCMSHTFHFRELLSFPLTVVERLVCVITVPPEVRYSSFVLVYSVYVSLCEQSETVQMSVICLTVISPCDKAWLPVPSIEVNTCDSVLHRSYIIHQLVHTVAIRIKAPSVYIQNRPHTTDTAEWYIILHFTFNSDFLCSFAIRLAHERIWHLWRLFKTLDNWGQGGR